MSVEAINKNQSYVSSVLSSETSSVSSSTEEDGSKVSVSEQDNETAVVYDKSGESESVYNEKTIQEMLSESNLKTENFKKLIESILNKQTQKFYSAFSKDSISEESLSGNLKDFFSNLEVDEETRLQAQEDISEDGYYGVKNTSERILDFAKALAGDDPDKLEEMYEAVKEGFAKAEKMWGGELPEICSQTYDAIEQGFEDWRNELSQNSSESE